jgi:RecA-family ATPase
VKWQYAAAIAAAGCGNDLPIHFLPGHFQLSAFLDDLIAKAEKIPNLRLVIIDSLQAFFEGENDNGNVEMMEAARRFRQLSDLDAGPSVLVIAHPAGKRPDKQNIVPRGGSAFSNELDGNLTVWAEPDGTQTLHHTEKFRGAPFDPLTFVMEDRQFDHLKDHKGRHMRLKVSRKQLDVEAASASMKAEKREHEALYMLDANPRLTQRALAESLGVSKSTADRIMQNLKDEKLIRRHAKKWVLTDGGKEFLNDE